MPLPHITIEGALVADPELRFTTAGVAVAKATVVAKERKRGSNGEWEDGDACFIDITCWRKQAENLAESCTKGDWVIVEGRLQQESWETEGQRRYKHSIVVDALGPSLRFNPAKTVRVERDSGQLVTAPQDDKPPF